MAVRSKTAVVVNRHPLWVKVLCDMVGEIGFEVLATATSIDEAICVVGTHAPDLVIAELIAADSGFGGARLIAAAREANPDVKCIAVSDENDIDLLDDAFAAGASAYCLKTAPADDFVTAIRQIFDRSIYFGAPHERPAARKPEPAGETPEPKSLTTRETEVLSMVADGRSNADVAKALWVTEQTVKFHLRNTYRKLGASNRTEASRWARENGLLEQVEADRTNVADSNRDRDVRSDADRGPLRAIPAVDTSGSKALHSAA